MSTFFLAKVQKNQDPQRLSHLLIKNGYSFIVGQSEEEMVGWLHHLVQPGETPVNENGAEGKEIPPGYVYQEDNEGFFEPLVKIEEPLFTVKVEPREVEMVDLEPEERTDRGDPVAEDMTQNKQQVKATTRARRQWTCPLTCGTTFPLSKLLVEHMASIHPGVQPFWCTHCPKKYDRTTSLWNHIDTTHSGNHKKDKTPKKASTRPREGKAAAAPRVAKATTRPRRHWDCPLACGVNFPVSKLLVDHMASSHPDVQPFWCNNCPKKYDKLASLLSHTRNNHTDKKSGVEKKQAPKSDLKCGGCGMVYMKDSAYKLHIQKYKNQPHYYSKPGKMFIVGNEADHEKNSKSRPIA